MIIITACLIKKNVRDFVWVHFCVYLDSWRTWPCSWVNFANKWEPFYLCSVLQPGIWTPGKLALVSAPVTFGLIHYKKGITEEPCNVYEETLTRLREEYFWTNFADALFLSPSAQCPLNLHPTLLSKLASLFQFRTN